MDVVRHDDELAQLVTFTRKIPKAYSPSFHVLRSFGEC